MSIAWSMEHDEGLRADVYVHVYRDVADYMWVQSCRVFVSKALRVFSSVERSRLLWNE